MEECFKCGISEERSKLHDAISGEGIVKICERCTLDGDVPFFRRKETSLASADRTAPVGGLIKEREKAFERIRSKKSPAIRSSDFSLRDLVEQNYRKNVDEERKSWPGMIRNFNWILLRARRNKGFGQKHLAEAIGEPEIAIRMAERGILPKEYVPFIRKVEKILEIELMDAHPFRLEEHKRMLDFKDTPSNKMTIGELRALAKKKEVETIKSQGILAKERIEQEKEEQKLLDGETDAGEATEYEKEKSSGFFKRIFSKKKSSSEETGEGGDFDSSEDGEIKDMSRYTSSTSSQSKEAPKSTLSSAGRSKETPKLSSQSKDGFKSDSPTPGRTKLVPKYRWQK